MLAYLSRYTHRVAISNRRLIAADKTGVTFKYKDYRIEGPGRYKTMTLETGEFIRRFLTHVLPKGFHRIRHYGLLASGVRADNLATMRILLAMDAPASKGKGSRQGQTARRRCAGAPLSLLRRPHAHHRDLRGKLPAAQAGTGSRWDRHVMSRSQALPPRLLPVSAAASRQAMAALARCIALTRSGLRNCFRRASDAQHRSWRELCLAALLTSPAAASRPHADGGGEILIALCSSGCPASRGFLP